MSHPLLEVLVAAANGRPPSPDCSVELLPPPPGPVHAVLTFTAHAYVAAPVDPERLRARLRRDDPGAASQPAFLAWLASELGRRAGQIDMVLAATHLDKPPPLDLEPCDDLAAHPRVARANRYRGHLRVLAERDGGGLLLLGRGLVGALAPTARHLVPQGEALFAQVTPANVASVRALLAAGYSPVASEVLLADVDDR